MRLKSSSDALLGFLLLLFLGALGPPVAAQEERDIPEVVRQLLDAAARAQERGRLDDAVASYRQAIELAPKVARAYVALGALYHQQGQREKALEVFRRGLEQAPAERALLTNAAAVALELGQAEAALELAERAVATDPQDADLRFLHGTVLRRLDRASEAVATLQQGLRQRPKDPRLLFALGNSYQQLGQLDEAIAAFRDALKADKDYLPAHYNLGAVLFEAERFDEARAAYEVALAPFDKALAKGETVDPVHAQAYLNLGAIFLRNKNWRQALNAYSKAARLDPASAAAHYHLGYALYQLGDDSAAATTYRKALELDPNLPVAHLHLAEIEARQGHSAEVVNHLRTTIGSLEGADQERGLWLLGQAQLKTGDEAAAEQTFRELRQLRPEDPTVAVALARILRRQGRRDEARPLLEEALRQDPNQVAAGLELAALARSIGDLEAEKALYLKVLERQGERPELAPVRLNLALVLLQQGDRAAARQRLEALLPELAEHQALRTAYALLLAEEGELAAAEKELRALLRRTPDYPPATTALAALEAFRGDAAAAARTFQAQGASTATGNPLLRADLGLALWSAGRGQEAQPHLLAAAETFPRWLPPRAALGEIARTQGDLDAASRWLESAAELCQEASTAHNPIAPGGGDQGRTFRLLVDGPQAPEGLCLRTRKNLGAVHAAVAYRALAAGDGGRARSLADEALTAPLATAEKALAHFVRGSAQLLAGNDEAARRDLGTALGGGLASSLQALARNNLGVAMHRLGSPDDARRQFEAARDGATAPPAALLNLGIAAESRGDGQAALDLYQRYLASGGLTAERRQEVSGWVEELKKVYR